MSAAIDALRMLNFVLDVGFGQAEAAGTEASLKLAQQFKALGFIDGATAAALEENPLVGLIGFGLGVAAVTALATPIGGLAEGVTGAVAEALATAATEAGSSAITAFFAETEYTVLGSALAAEVSSAVGLMTSIMTATINFAISEGASALIQYLSENTPLGALVQTVFGQSSNIYNNTEIVYGPSLPTNLTTWNAASGNISYTVDDTQLSPTPITVSIQNNASLGVVQGIVTDGTNTVLTLDYAGTSGASSVVVNGGTIDPTITSPPYITEAADGSVVVGLPDSTDGNAVLVDYAASGTVTIMIGVDGDTSGQDLISFSGSDFSGDTLDITGSGITTDIGSADTFELDSDSSLPGISQDFDFAGSSGTLRLDSPTSFTGTISNFAAGDTIDLVGVAGVVSAGLGSDNLLTLQESGGGTVDLSLDLEGNSDSGDLLFEPDGSGGTDIVNSASLAPGDVLDLVDAGAPSPFVTGNYVSNQDVNFYLSSGLSGVEADPTKIANESFLIAPDGAYGTDVTDYEDNQSIAFTGPNEVLMIADADNFTGTLTNVQIGDTIYFGSPYNSASGPTLEAGNVLSIAIGVSIKLDPTENFNGDGFLFTNQGYGPLVQVAPAPTESGVQTFTVYPGTDRQASVTIPTSMQFSPVRATLGFAGLAQFAQYVPLTVTYAGGAASELRDLSQETSVSVSPQNPVGTIEIPDYYEHTSSFDGANFTAVLELDNVKTVDVSATVPVYNVAQAAFSINGSAVSSYDFGVVHLGQTTSVEIGISNAATGTLVDTLSSNIGQISEFSATSSVANLASGQSGMVKVDFTATTDGSVTVGPTLFDLTSHDSVLPDVPAQAFFTLSAEAYAYAEPTLMEAINGDTSGILTQTGTNSWTLNFGTIDGYNTTLPTQGNEIAIGNAATNDLYVDTLGGSVVASGGGFIETIPGQIDQYSHAYTPIYIGTFAPNPEDVGVNTATVVYDPTSIDSGGTTALQAITLTVTDDVVKPTISGATVEDQGSTSTVSVDAGQTAVLDPLFNSGLAFDTLIIQGPGTAEVDASDSVKNLIVYFGGHLLLNGGEINTDPVTIDSEGNISGYGVVTGNVSTHGEIEANGGTLDITGNVSGSASVTLTQGSAIQFEGTVSSSISLLFTGSDETLIVGASADVLAPISGFGLGDSIVLEDQQVTGAVYDPTQNMLEITGSGGSTYSLSLIGTYQQSNFGVADGEVQVACFRAGTRISTEHGDVPVENLAIGDIVHAHLSGLAAVKWLGHRRVDCRGHPKPCEVWPVRIQAGAFGDGLPHSELWLSPDHAVFIDGVLIPIRYLVNGRTVVQESRDTVTYWHVELERHDVIIAEGLLCESYLETGNRSAFANGGPPVALYPDFASQMWDAMGCAPLIVYGAELEAARSFLLRRAEELSHPIRRRPSINSRSGVPA